MNFEVHWHSILATTAMNLIVVLQVWTISMTQPEHLLGHGSPILETIALNFFKWALMIFLSEFIVFLIDRIKKIYRLV